MVFVGGICLMSAVPGYMGCWRRMPTFCPAAPGDVKVWEWEGVLDMGGVEEGGMAFADVRCAVRDGCMNRVFPARRASVPVAASG